MKKKNTQSLALLLFLVTLCTVAFVFSDSQSEKQHIISQCITPEIKTITQKKIISGNLYPIKEIEVKSSVSGVLESYFVQIGDVVKIGDKIAKIKMLPEPSQVESARTNLNKTYITFQNDQINYKRDKELYEKRIISQSEFEAMEKNFLISKEQYESAKNQLRLLEEGYIPNSNISNVVTATVNGTIIDLPLNEGMPVSERNTFRDGSTIALIGQMESFLFKGKVVENDILTLRKGMKLSVLPTSYPDFQAEASISKISPKGHWDQGIIKYNLEAVMTLPDTVLVYSGFNAVAEFILKERENVLTIPEQCVIFENDSSFVEVLEKQKFVRKSVNLGISNGLIIEIINGINANDKIREQLSIK